MLTIEQNISSEEDLNTNKKVPKFFKDVDECAAFCATCTEPIKILKALLVWARLYPNKADQDNALLVCADRACHKASELGNDQAILFITKELTTIGHVRGMIEKNQRYTWT